MSARSGPVGVRPARPDVSMSLLADLMGNTIDAGYAERAAVAETRDGRRAASPVGRTVGVLLLVGLGLLTGTGVAQVRERATASASVRTGLAEEVRRRSAQSDQLADQAAQLRADVAARRDRALAADAQGRQVADLVGRLEIATGVSAVSGPGVVLTLDDAPATKDPTASPGVGSLSAGRVLDRDLQGVVNGLWAAGAEAISINGVRLSARTAIRSAGAAILVDFKPLSPPYRIEAIGRSNTLETGFVDSVSGRRLQTLSSVSGISYGLQRADRLTLPAGTEPQLRAARPVQGPP